jgi:hypothetical protein
MKMHPPTTPGSGGSEVRISHSDPGGDYILRFTKFWAIVDENSDDDEAKETEISTPTREDFIDAAEKIGVLVRGINPG